MFAEKRFESTEYNIFYRIAGTGTSLVFIHGFAEDGTVWDELINSLQNRFQCIIPDLPGSGRSTMVRGEWSMEGLAEAVRSVLSHEGISAPVLIGHSMGGYITLAFVEKYPDQVKAFGLFHSTAYPDNEEKKNTRRKGIEFIQQHGAAKFLEQATPNLFSPGFKEQHPEVVQELIDRYTNFSALSLVNYYEAMMQRPDRTHVLKNFPGAVLFVMGEHDNAIPLSDGLQQCHLASLSYIHILKNSGHMGMFEETARCREILEKFLLDL